MVHFDRVASIIQYYAVERVFGTMKHWKAQHEKKSMFQYSSTQLLKYSKNLASKDKELNSLSLPQLYVLHGKLCEKDITQKQLEEVNRLLV